MSNLKGFSLIYNSNLHTNVLIHISLSVCLSMFDKMSNYMSAKMLFFILSLDSLVTTTLASLNIFASSQILSLSDLEFPLGNVSNNVMYCIIPAGFETKHYVLYHNASNQSNASRLWVITVKRHNLHPNGNSFNMHLPNIIYISGEKEVFLW